MGGREALSSTDKPPLRVHLNRNTLFSIRNTKKHAKIFGYMTNNTYIAQLIPNHALASAGQAFFMVLNVLSARRRSSTHSQDASGSEEKRSTPILYFFVFV